MGRLADESGGFFFCRLPACKHEKDDNSYYSTVKRFRKELLSFSACVCAQDTYGCWAARSVISMRPALHMVEPLLLFFFLVRAALRCSVVVVYYFADGFFLCGVVAVYLLVLLLWSSCVTSPSFIPLLLYADV